MYTLVGPDKRLYPLDGTPAELVTLAGPSQSLYVIEGPSGTLEELVGPSRIIYSLSGDRTVGAGVFSTIQVTGLTASRLVATDSGKSLESVSDLTSWVAGTANQITVADDGDGTLTLTTPQSIATTSDVAFGTVTVNSLITDEVRAGLIDITEQETPAAPAADKIRIYAAEDADFTVLETITDLGVINRINQDTFRIARNTSGGSLAKGTVVRYTGSTGNQPNFSAAQANAIATMPAVGILGTAVANNTFGEVMIVGRITGIKTDYTTVGEPTYAPVADWAEGDVLYVNTAVLGGLQNSKPVHPNVSQWIATIETVHASQGIILVKMQAMLGLEDGTNSNTFTVGDTGAGTKSLKFDGTADGQIDWTGTAFEVSAAVGIGTTPAELLHVFTSNTSNLNARMILETADTGQNAGVIVKNPAGRDGVVQFWDDGVRQWRFGAISDNFAIAYYSGSWSTKVSVDSAGNMLMGGSTAHANSVQNIAIKEGTAPGGAVADQCFLWAQNDAGTAEMYVQDGAGNQTPISPHNKAGEWEFFSRNVKTGREVRINMERLIKAVEALTGEKFMVETLAADGV
jgi:hypothetical protein